jgi:CheY-like chemotaxis protein
MAAEFQPSVILLDLMMPVMNGWEFLVARRAFSDLAGIPVLILTAPRHPAPAGMGPVFFKPVHIESLLRAIDNAL